MALIDILRERVSRKGNTAQVLCGELGTVTVEALSPAECHALLRGANGPRSVLYAACRELQAAGEDLRRSGKLFRPEEIMDFLSEEELQAGFTAVLEISGVSRSPAGEANSGIQQTPSEFAGFPADTSFGATAADGAPHLEDTHTQTPAGAPLHSNLSPGLSAALPDIESRKIPLTTGDPAPMQTVLPDEAALAEQVAGCILDGLRQAAAVR